MILFSAGGWIQWRHDGLLDGTPIVDDVQLQSLDCSFPSSRQISSVSAFI